MPIHEYKCKKCGTRIEVLQKLRDKPLQTCRKCGGALIKLVSSPAIQFKGSGFYITDYAHKNVPAKEEKPKEKPEKTKATPAKDTPPTTST